MIKKFWNFKDKSIKVKICGITTLETAYNVAQIGSDAIGFHIWNKRNKNMLYEDIKKFEYISKFLPPDLSCWIVTNIVDFNIIKNIINKINFDTLQIQGKVPLKDFLNLLNNLNLINKSKKIKIVKNISMNQKENKIFKSINTYLPYIDGIILDSGWKGGSGLRSYSWNLAAKIVKQVQKPIILAGGLNPKNVAQAIAIVDPYGVDVETGVEIIVGYYKRKKVKCKSILKIKNFIENAKLLK